MKSMKIGLGFLAIAAVILIPSILNFIAFSDAKAAYLFDRSSESSYDIYYSEFVDSGHNYTIDVEIDDYIETFNGSVYEETVNASLEIFIDGISVFNEHLYQHDYSYDDESYVDAWVNVIYSFVSIDTVNITISGTMYEGDNWDIKIYQDLPSSFAEQELQIVIIAFIGIGFFLFGICILVFGKSKPR